MRVDSGRNRTIRDFFGVLSYARCNEIGNRHGSAEVFEQVIAGAITIVGLGLVWVTVAVNFPSQEELSSAAVPAETRQAARPLSSLSAPPTLDLTIPTSPPLPSEAAMPKPDDDRSRDSSVESSCHAIGSSYAAGYQD